MKVCPRWRSQVLEYLLSLLSKDTSQTGVMVEMEPRLHVSSLSCP